MGQHIKAHHDILDDGFCYTCHSVARALEDVAHRNKTVKDRLVATSNGRKYEWSNETFAIDVGKFVRDNLEMVRKAQNCLDFLVFCGKKVIVRRIHLDTIPPTTAQNRMYAGGEFP